MNLDKLKSLLADTDISDNATRRKMRVLYDLKDELLAVVEAAEHFKRGVRQDDNIGTEYALHLALAALEKRLETV